MISPSNALTTTAAFASFLRAVFCAGVRTETKVRMVSTGIANNQVGPPNGHFISYPPLSLGPEGLPRWGSPYFRERGTVSSSKGFTDVVSIYLRSINELLMSIANLDRFAIS